MDKLKKYHQIIEATLKEHLAFPTRDFPNLQHTLSIDERQRRFLLLTVGWDRDHYHHGMDYHIELKSDGKVWIHIVNTDVLIDEELIEAGIDKNDIVAGMIEPYELDTKVKTAA